MALIPESRRSFGIPAKTWEAKPPAWRDFWGGGSRMDPRSSKEDKEAAWLAYQMELNNYYAHKARFFGTKRATGFRPAPLSRR